MKRCDTCKAEDCYCPSTNNIQGENSWEENFDKCYPYGLFCGDVKCPDALRDHSIGVKNLITLEIQKAEARVLEEERQFILNILDGIDIADKQMMNAGGGTKAIRFTLQSRYSGQQQNVASNFPTNQSGE